MAKPIQDLVSKLIIEVGVDEVITMMTVVKFLKSSSKKLPSSAVKSGRSKSTKPDKICRKLILTMNKTQMAKRKANRSRSKQVKQKQIWQLLLVRCLPTAATKKKNKLLKLFLKRTRKKKSKKMKKRKLTLMMTN